MTTNLFISIIVLLQSEFLFRLFDAEMDTIRFRPTESWFSKKTWYVSNNWQTKNWFLKVPFSMFLDGWHFIKFLAQMARIFPMAFFACMLCNYNLLFTIPISILLYAFGGIVWESTYGD